MPANPSKEIPRHELIAAALDLGIERPDTLTQAELQQRIREVSERPAPAPEPRPALGRGWFSVARHLVASVIEKGLNLPTAARVLRETVRSVPPERPPLPTVTLAQIYIAQGHAERAIATLEQVLKRDPKNPKALRLWAELLPKGSSGPGSSPTWAPRDALIVVHTLEGSFAYWELCRATWERYSAADDAAPPPSSPSPKPRVQLKASLFTPSESGTEARELVFPVPSPTGFTLLTSDVLPFVRASVGHQNGERWVPLVVASTFRFRDGDYAQEFSPRKSQLDRDVLSRGVRALDKPQSVPPSARAS